MCVYIFLECCGIAFLCLIHSIISVKQTSKQRLCSIWKYCCKAKTRFWCITNTHICTLSKLAVWYIRIPQIGNYSIPSSPDTHELFVIKILIKENYNEYVTGLRGCVLLTLILRRSRTGTVWFYTSTSNNRAARPKLYTKSLTRDLKRMYSRLTLVRISINL